MGKLVKTVYGDALFDLAKEKDQVEELMAEVTAMKQILQDNPDFCSVMMHPQIHKKEKQALLAQVFDRRTSDHMLGFLQLITEKEHFGELSDIFVRYEECYRNYHGIGIAVITSATELTETQKTQIEEKLSQTTSYQKVLTEYQVDPTLIGGIVIRIGDRVVDGSIKNKLNRLTKQLTDMQLASDE